jgi:hypothetical protein
MYIPYIKKIPRMMMMINNNNNINNTPGFEQNIYEIVQSVSVWF